MSDGLYYYVLLIDIHEVYGSYVLCLGLESYTSCSPVFYTEAQSHTLTKATFKPVAEASSRGNFKTIRVKVINLLPQYSYRLHSSPR
jgi:hypothetical protein